MRATGVACTLWELWIANKQCPWARAPQGHFTFVLTHLKSDSLVSKVRRSRVRGGTELRAFSPNWSRSLLQS